MSRLRPEPLADSSSSLAPPSAFKRRARSVALLCLTLAALLVPASTALAAKAFVLTGSGASAAFLPIDLGTRTAGASVPVGFGVPVSAETSLDAKTVWVLTQNDGMYSIDVATNEVKGAVIDAPQLENTQGFAFSPDGKTAWVVTAKALHPLDLVNRTVGAAVTPAALQLASALGPIAISPDGEKATVLASGAMYTFALSTGAVVSEKEGIPGFTGPRNLYYLGDGVTVVGDSQAGVVVSFDTVTGAYKGIAVPDGTVRAVAVPKTGTTVYASVDVAGGTEDGIVPVDVAAGTSGTRLTAAASGTARAGGTALSPNERVALTLNGASLVFVDLFDGALPQAVALGVTGRDVAVAPDPPALADPPTIELQYDSQSGVVGDPTNPTVEVTVGQLDSGEQVPIGELTVAATGTPADMLPPGSITVTGTGATRTLHFEPAQLGYGSVSVEVSGRDGLTASAQLTYAASGATTTTSRVFQGMSDVSTAIDAGEGFAIVADDEADGLALYRTDRSGPPVKQFGAFGLGGEVDWESSAREGDTIYWLGSHGNNSNGLPESTRQQVLVTKVSGRGDRTSLERVGYYNHLLDDIRAYAIESGNPLGLYEGNPSEPASNRVNIEGSEMAPGSASTIYLGMRTPLAPAGKAVILPVTNIDRLTDGRDGEAAFGEPILLDLGGFTIREIRKNDSDQYLIIAGRGTAREPQEAALYSWTGEREDAPVLLTSTLPQAVEISDDNPAGLETILSVPDVFVPGAQIRLAQDQGEDRLYEPDLHTKNKAVADLRLKKSRHDVVTLTGVVGAQAEAPAPAFPNQPAATVGPGRWVAVTNTGSQNLRLDDVRVLGADLESAGDFLIGQESCKGAVLSPGETCQVLLRFAPARESVTSNAFLVLRGNVPDGEELVPLTATSTTLAQGPPGEDGEDGAPGTPGEDGEDGAPGADGQDGQDGAPGADGQGSKGDKGDAGPQGPQGIAGRDGADGTFRFITATASTSVVRGKTARLKFRAVNDTTAQVSGALVRLVDTDGLQVAGKRSVKIPTIGAGETKTVSLPLRVGTGAKPGRYAIKVKISVGAESATRQVKLIVTRRAK